MSSNYEAINKTQSYSQQDSFEVDIEKTVVDGSYLKNDSVRSFAWKGINVTVKDHKTKPPKSILQDVSGIVEAGNCPKLELHSLDYAH